MAHLHSIYDSDLHFVIDPDTRVITNQMENKNSVIQFDHNSERFTFELPRYIEEHDMLSCNRVEVHYLNIESKTGNQREGVYEVQDLQVSPHDDKVVICSWLVSNNATQYAGTLNFVIRFACTQGDVVDYVWNTAVFKNYAVQNGLYNSDPIVEQYPDVLAQWYESLFTASADGVTNIQEARAAAITAVDAVADERIADIEQAGSEVIASLPEDYLEMLENMAPPIVETATGAAIAIRDSADRKLRGLTLYGKSTQDGTPTPEAPVEIVSVENSTVRVWGKNFAKSNRDGEISSAGVTVTQTKDSSDLVVSGTATKATSITAMRGISLPAGRYIVSVHGLNVIETSYDRIYITDSEENVLVNYVRTGTPLTFEVDNDSTASITIIFAEGSVYDNQTINVQIEQGDVATTYEPYTEQTIPLTRTLPGIPVTSDGNYTDENGQQWVCDEVDFGRGVYVQRTKTFDLNTLKVETWHTWGVNHSTDGVTGFYHYFIEDVTSDQVLSNIGEYSIKAWGGVGAGVSASADGNYFMVSVPTEVLVDVSTEAKAIESFLTWIADTKAIILAAVAPTETALTPEELAAYASLRSNYPNTTVLNDGGAGMAVAYVADTKLYIDKKLAE